MTPRDLAILHARAMTTTAAWSETDFIDLLTHSGSFLATPHNLTGPEISRGARGAEPLAPRDDEVGANSSLTAFALGRVIADEAELLTLAVDPNYQRVGLGQQCLDAFETAATSAGATRAFLEVAATNSAALALYRRSGWTQDGTRRAYYRTSIGPIDAILMSKSLLPA